MTKKELRNFGLLIGASIGVLFGLLFPWIFSNSFPKWPWLVFAALTIVSLLLPFLLFPVYKVWMIIGHWLGWINTRIILGIIFYLVFFPFGICLKLIGKDPMMRKLNREEEKSYRIPSSPKNIELMKEPY
tara:strand:+ start:53 stop:442 length:390 start_codon:yes stop_codon:yes gene_type:complete